MVLAFAIIALFMAVVLILPFYRVYKGPTVFDRLLGAAAVGSKTIALILLFGLLYGRLEFFVDIALAYAVLNFLVVLAIAKYFTVGDEESEG